MSSTTAKSAGSSCLRDRSSSGFARRNPRGGACAGDRTPRVLRVPCAPSSRPRPGSARSPRSRATSRPVSARSAPREDTALTIDHLPRSPNHRSTATFLASGMGCSPPHIALLSGLQGTGMTGRQITDVLQRLAMQFGPVQGRLLPRCKCVRATRRPKLVFDRPRLFPGRGIAGDDLRRARARETGTAPGADRDRTARDGARAAPPPRVPPRARISEPLGEPARRRARGSPAPTRRPPGAFFPRSRHAERAPRVRCCFFCAAARRVFFSSPENFFADRFVPRSFLLLHPQPRPG